MSATTATKNIFWTPVALSYFRSDIPAIKECLEANVDFYATNELGNNCFHMAAGNGHTEIIRYLFEKFLCTNANSEASAHERALRLLNGENQSKNTPLHWAVLNFQAETVKLLLELGADTSLQNRESQNPLDLALSLENEEMIEILAPKTRTTAEESILLSEVNESL